MINDRHTKVCSRHFKASDFTKTLAGLRKLKQDAVPSIFQWKQDSPRKRKAPKERRVLSPKRTRPSHSNSNTEPTCIEPKTKEFACQTNITLAEFNNVLENSSRLPKLLDNTKSLNETVTELQDQIRCNEIMISKLEKNVAALNDQLKKKAKECYALNDELKSTIEKCQKSERKNERFFSVNKFLNDNAAMLFYTGFLNAEISESYLEFLQPGKNGKNIKYKNASYVDNNYSGAKPGKPRSLDPKEEFFLTLCRLRQGFPEDHLSHLYGIHQSTVSRIIVSWISFIYLKSSKICIWPSREQVGQHTPEDFKNKYPNTRVIIDCTEIKCQMPSSLLLNSRLYSSYKKPHDPERSYRHYTWWGHKFYQFTLYRKNFG